MHTRKAREPKNRRKQVKIDFYDKTRQETRERRKEQQQKVNMISRHESCCLNRHNEDTKQV